MRVGVFHNKPYYLRYYETALRVLLERGHHLVLARPDRFEEVKVPASLRRSGHVSTALHPHARSDALGATTQLVRTVRDAARYLTPELRPAHASRGRAFERLSQALTGNAHSLPAAGGLLQTEWTEHQQTTLRNLFEYLERLIPADEGLMRFIQEQQLDLVFCISRVNIASAQTEVVKAAAQLGVPSGVAVYSWDNLSNKGVLHVLPDRVFVWNEIQLREAAELHGIEPARVGVTGSPRFDTVFARAPSSKRADLLGELGLDPARSTVLYLGSSSFVAPREPDFVTAWINALRACADERVREANVIVRPHPGAVAKPLWAEWATGAARAVLPPPIVRSRDQDLFDQLWVSDAVVGLNTSAEIEAAILDKPVLTVKAGALAPGQEGQLHFRYIVEEHGGFVQTAESLDQHVHQLGEALTLDPLAQQRRRFLERFVRPHGIDVPAGPVLADAIEALGRERSGSRLGLRSWGELVRRSALSA
jgi:hypothetical protein